MAKCWPPDCRCSTSTSRAARSCGPCGGNVIMVIDQNVIPKRNMLPPNVTRYIWLSWVYCELLFSPNDLFIYFLLFFISSLLLFRCALASHPGHHHVRGVRYIGSRGVSHEQLRYQTSYRHTVIHSNTTSGIHIIQRCGI